ncbi:hypothetical protein HP548_05535 [Paenibacillus taichungensis]|uniref:5-bromo-4-chloroindolyl phosphate hydrolysis protein n=1 Tax=Paenibacillus taichungensis TaxID=484184 RepID=A0ABX2MF40_9BACL|nr:hypothetical protein [Paenibacillus taichungensis]NUU53538.1 hypothetical protein [Paenibacillus taichungensis]
MFRNRINSSAFIILTLSVGISFCAYTLLSGDKDFNKLNSILSIFTALGTSIIGGYIAFYASYIQIKANKQSEELKNIKQNLAQCLLAKYEIEYIIKLLNKCLERNVKYLELKKHLSFNAIERLRNENILLLEEDKIKQFLSLFNKLSLLKLAEDEQNVQKPILENIIADLESMLLVIENYQTILSNNYKSPKDLW